MSVRRFTAIFALIGVLIACSLNVIWSLFERSIDAGLHYDAFLKGTLLLFPASIGTIAISGANYWNLDHFVLIGMNGVLYALAGLLVWLGLRKHRAFLALGGLLYAVLVAAVWTLH